ncbi:MAG: hypothetical protein IKM63_08550 [Firmicutes bacterium]|nr:hypothetical protein [Bacillota bacterium]
MNRNALTEQRRETVIGLLKGMNIKKSAGEGFDKDDVYDCMQQLCDLYEKSIEDLQNSYEAELGQLKDRYQKYDENNELYVSLIMEAKKSSNDIIAQAKTEVETILAEGKEQIAQQEKDLEQLRVDIEVEKQAMIAELNASREAVEAEKAAMKAEVEAEREKTSATKNKYTQQLNAMEEEFEEIKTNILRTAGKIDSLKSKLPNDEEAEWKMMNDLEAVDFPAAEIEIESIVETPATYEAVAVEEVVAAPIAEKPVLEEETFTLEDLTAPEGFAGIPDAEPVEEFSLEDIEIELPELEEVTEAVEEAPVEELDLEEISFEGLEELFKEEK